MQPYLVLVIVEAESAEVAKRAVTGPAGRIHGVSEPIPTGAGKHLVEFELRPLPRREEVRPDPPSPA